MKNNVDYTTNYCIICNKNIDPIIINEKLTYKDEFVKIEYIGHVAKCPYCGESIFSDECNKYNNLVLKFHH